MDAMVIKNGRVIDPKNNVQDFLDVMIEGDKITKLAKNITPEPGVEVIDATGCLVMPGLVDIHVHFRDPGYEYKEDILSGCKAAVAGGFTTVCCKANTNPVNDNGAITRYIRDKAKQINICNLYPIGAVTKGLEGKELAEIGDMVENGALAISDDGKCVTNSDVLRRALEYAKHFNIPVADHCEDPDLTKGGVVHEGKFSVITGLKGMPACAEEVMVARDVIVAGYVKGRIHIDHVSTKGSVSIIERAKNDGINVTCEVTPHHLALTDEEILSFDTSTKVNPPLRGIEHVEALMEALNSGVIDAIATDHAPHGVVDKDVEYTEAAFGISGLETALSVIYTLVDKGKLSLMRSVEAMTYAPAKIYGIDAGYIEVGKVADLVIFNPNIEWTVDPDRFFSKGKNTPFKGRKLKGKVVYTIFKGRVVYKQGEIIL